MYLNNISYDFMLTNIELIEFFKKYIELPHENIQKILY
jgi:hypothetical protein